MDLSPSDYSLTSDYVVSNYNYPTSNITPVAIFLIFILIAILVIFYFTNLTTSHFDSIEKTKSETELKSELAQSINKLSDVLNKEESKQKTNDIAQLQNTIHTLKNEISLIHNKVEKSNPTININADNANNENYIDDVTIYDPIANYDRLKLFDPLVDPRGRSSADQIPTPQVAAQLNFPTQGVIDRYHRVGLLIALDSESKYNNKLDKFNFYGNSKKNKNYSNSSNYSTTESNYLSNLNIPTNKYSGVEIISDSSLKRKNKKSKRKNKNIETFDTNYFTDTTDDNLTTDSYESFSVKKSNNMTVNYDDNNILELIGKKITDNWYKYFTSISVGNKIIKITVHNRNRRELYDGDIVYIHELKKNYKVQIDPMDMIEYNPYYY